MYKYVATSFLLKCVSNLGKSLTNIYAYVKHNDTLLIQIWASVFLFADKRHNLVVDTKHGITVNIQLIRNLLIGKRRQSFYYEPFTQGQGPTPLYPIASLY